jgi:type IV pilus assembly protein PilV
MRKLQRGATLIEVLVAIVIVVIGLLGLAGLQARINLSEMESFQRTQAIVLMQDMVDRIISNRKNAASYITGAPLGTGNGSADCSGLFMADKDLCEWNNALLGAAEATAAGKVGAMIGARGCIQQTVATMPQQYVISVTWQGLNPTVAPAATLNCAQGLYGPDDRLRRIMTTTVTMACLQNDPAGGCVTNPAPAPLH